MTARFRDNHDSVIGCAIESAADCLRRADRIDNEADPRVRREILDAMLALGNAINVMVFEATA